MCGLLTHDSKISLSERILWTLDSGLRFLYRRVSLGHSTWLVLVKVHLVDLNMMICILLVARLPGTPRACALVLVLVIVVRYRNT